MEMATETARETQAAAKVARDTVLPMPSLEYTDEVARETAHLYERVKDVIPAIEWPVMAPYIKAINDLKKVRNAKPLWSKYGTVLGGIALSGLDLWTNRFGFSFFGTLGHGKTDAEATEPAAKHTPIAYPKPDGVVTFDRLSSVFVSNTAHEEDQPVHLHVRDMALQKSSEHDVFGGPSTRYCPAGVYEWIEEGADAPRFQINAANCVHCKTCDIKDPNQNIDWVPPEGGGGPNYPNM